MYNNAPSSSAAKGKAYYVVSEKSFTNKLQEKLPFFMIVVGVKMKSYLVMETAIE